MSRVLAEEHKRKMVEGRKAKYAAKRKKAPPPAPKKVRKPGEKVVRVMQPKGIVNKDKMPLLWITGKEKDAFDFFTPIRASFQGIHDYLSSPIIIKEITKKVIWQDISAIKEILNKYAVVKIIKY